MARRSPLAQPALLLLALGLVSVGVRSDVLDGMLLEQDVSCELLQTSHATAPAEAIQVSGKARQSSVMSGAEKSPRQAPPDVIFRNLYGESIHQFCQPWRKWAYVGICLFFAFCCFCYEVPYIRELYAANQCEQTKLATKRNPAWDFFKFVCVAGVIDVHIVIRAEQRSIAGHAWFGTPITMCGLTFISGLFSGSCLTARSLIATVVGLPTTIFMYDVVLYLVKLAVGGAHGSFLIFSLSVDWYLWCLIGWRLAIAPIMQISKMFGPVATFSMWLAVFVICWVQWTLLDIQPYDLFPFSYPWHMLYSLGPYFALGLVFSVSRWEQLLFNPFITVVAWIVMAMYLLVLNPTEWFREWFDVGCYYLGQCNETWWTIAITGRELSLKTFVAFTRDFLLHTVSGLTVVSVSGSILSTLSRFAPTVADVFAACGSRTLYSYLLHWALLIEPLKLTGLFTSLNAFIVGGNYPCVQYDSPDNCKAYGLYNWSSFARRTMVVLFVNFVLCSALTERVFGFITRTPEWFLAAAGLLPTSAKAMKEPADATAATGGAAADLLASVNGGRGNTTKPPPSAAAGAGA